MTATVVEPNIEVQPPGPRIFDARPNRREMNAGIHHPKYRVIPAGFARGYWVGVCKECPPAEAYQSAKGTPHSAEKAVWAHLKDKHKVEVTRE